MVFALSCTDIAALLWVHIEHLCRSYIVHIVDPDRTSSNTVDIVNPRKEQHNVGL